MSINNNIVLGDGRVRHCNNSYERQDGYYFVSEPIAKLVAAPATKYKVGDYLTAPYTVFLHIVCVIPAENPIYALVSPKNTAKAKDLLWHTEWELEQLGLNKNVPDFSKWTSIAIGDPVYIAQEDGSGHTHYVLAKVGDCVLLSNHPKSRKEQQANAKLQEQLDKLLEEVEEHGQDVPGLQVSANIMREATTRTNWDLKWEEMLTGNKAFKIAGSWYTTEELALMNWELAKE